MTGAHGVDVLLGHALFMALDPKQVEKMRPYPPLGTLYAAAVLRERGYRVALFDAMLAAGEADFAAALERERPRVVVLYEDSFNFLSKMCLERMRRAALAMTGMARERGVPVLVAGSDATDEPGAYLAAGASAVLLGEGDWTVADALDALRPTAPAGALESVAGLALAAPGGGVRRTAGRPPERDPDRFPWPARDLVDLEAYRGLWEGAHGLFSLNMVATRGCPFHCNWCAKPIWGQRYAMRSAADVAAEMADLKRRMRPDHVWFADDIFGLRPEWTAELGREVEARGAQIPFQIQSRVDLLTPSAVEGLARAGCVEVWMGVESGSQRVLDAMEKGIRVEQVPEAVARLRAHGIRACFFLQFGYPGETWADIEATAGLVRALLPDEIGISVSYPLPGTRFHDLVAAQLGAKRHWTDSEDLAMIFEGTFTTELYRALHRTLHHELEVRREGDVQAIAGLEGDWRALRRLAEESRSAAPTRLGVEAPRRPAPDLTQSAN